MLALRVGYERDFSKVYKIRRTDDFSAFLFAGPVSLCGIGSPRRRFN